MSASNRLINPTAGRTITAEINKTTHSGESEELVDFYRNGLFSPAIRYFNGSISWYRHNKHWH
jgi:hypothetical protein